MTKIDLKTNPFLRENFGKTLGRGTHVCRTTDFQAGYGLHAIANISSVCGKVSRRVRVRNFLVSISFFAWHLLRSLTERVSRYRSVPSFSKKNSIIWASVAKSPDQLSPTPTKVAIGAFSPNWLRASSQLLASFTEKTPFIDDLEETVYTLDSTTIDLCLSVFPWASFRKSKGAVKLHTLLDLNGNIPTFIHISDGKLHDVNALDLLPLEIGAYYVMDLGYLDFKRLYAFNQVPAFFVTRAKSNTKYKRRYSHPVDRITGLICDQTILLTGFYAKKDYPEALRRVKFHDTKTNRTLVFLTNNFSLPALTITQLYQSRWQVELFFKWIKQHLRSYYVPL